MTLRPYGGGHNLGGGHGGGHGGPGLATVDPQDAWMLSGALASTRAAIAAPTTEAYQGLSMPIVGHAGLPEFARWDGGLHAYIVVPQLLEPISMQAVSGNAWGLSAFGQPALTITRPSLPAFAAEINKVMLSAGKRMERQQEILTQSRNAMPFWSTVVPLSVENRPATSRLLAIAMEFVSHTQHRFKHEFACRRPHEFSPQIQPMIPTPRHGTYPMGHGCEATVVASLLVELICPTVATPSSTQLEIQLEKLVLRIAENRVIAGVHFPMDALGGIALGKWIAQYLVLVAKGHDSYGFNNVEFDVGKHTTDLAKGDYASIDSVIGNSVAGGKAVTAIPSWKAMFESAYDEWTGFVRPPLSPAPATPCGPTLAVI